MPKSIPIQGSAQIPRRRYSLKHKACIPALAAHLFIAGFAAADSINPAIPSEWAGTVGAGPMSFSKYTGGSGTRTQLLPLISANYKEILYIEPLRATLYFAGSAEKKIGLGFAVEPRMGFHSSDGSRLAGMATRRNSLEGGPSLDWDAGVIAISISYFTDLTHASGGTSSRLYFYKDVIKNETWQFGANLGVDHMSAKVTNYFFGTAPNEATAFRPLYRPGSASNIVWGFDGHYKLNQRNSIVFGMQQTNLKGDAANSPLVETKHSHVGWVGLAWNL
jgi:outer membrane protein